MRAICHLRQAYSREEMARPFVVVRTELAPDYADPETRRVLAARAISSGAEIFGPADERPVSHAPIAEVVDDLASEPDFADADVHAEEAGDDDVDMPVSIAESIGHDDVSVDALTEAIEESAAAPGPDEPEPAQHEPAPTPTAGTCDDCGVSLTPPVVAYCQSPRGQATFGGARYCYTCQKKHRPARTTKAVA